MDKTTKNCAKCKTLKDINLFSAIKSRKGDIRLHSYCIDCRRLASKEYSKLLLKKEKVGIKEKNCTGCNIVKKIEEFNKNHYHSDGRDYHCRNCRKKYRDMHKEEIRSVNKEWYNKNKKRKSWTARLNYLNKKEEHVLRNKEWRERNPEKVKLKNLNGRMRRVGVEKLEAYEIETILKIYQNKCAYCDCDLSGGHHIDHVIPIIIGGRNTINNVVPSCQFCNTSKGAKEVNEWYENKFGKKFIQKEINLMLLQLA